MSRTPWIVASLLTVAVIAPRAARARDPRSLTINLSRAAGDAVRTPSLNAVDRCLGAYDKVRAAGLDDSVEVELDDVVGAREAGASMTVGELHAACIEAMHMSEATVFTNFFVGPILAIEKRIDNHANPDIAALSRLSKECAAAVDQTLADGVPPDTAIEVPRYGYKGTLATVKAEVCAKGQAAFERWMQANMAPFAKVGLENDKLKMMLKTYPEPYYLAGGRASTDARQLAKASVWFFDSPHDGDYCNGDAVLHTLHRYKFDKSQHATETTKVYCGAPPARAYR